MYHYQVEPIPILKALYPIYQPIRWKKKLLTLKTYSVNQMTICYFFCSACCNSQVFTNNDCTLALISHILSTAIPLGPTFGNYINKNLQSYIKLALELFVQGQKYSQN